MATPMEKPILNGKHSINDNEDSSSSTGCGCFRLLGFKRLRINENEEEKRQVCKQMTWWVKKMRKMNELSEVFAVPKWKIFIRKVGGYCKGKGQNDKVRFQYDPQSYALNFDCGFDRGEDDHPLLDFSLRFTAPLEGTENRTL